MLMVVNLNAHKMWEMYHFFDKQNVFSEFYVFLKRTLSPKNKQGDDSSYGSIIFAWPVQNVAVRSQTIKIC